MFYNLGIISDVSKEFNWKSENIIKAILLALKHSKGGVQSFKLQYFGEKTQTQV